MRKQRSYGLYFGVFLLAALTTSRAGLIIDNFSNGSGTITVSGANGQANGSSVASGTVAGNRVASVQNVGADPTTVVASTAFGTDSASFSRDAATTAGYSVHTITWTAAAYDLLKLSGSSSMATLSFMLDVNHASSSQSFLITVWQDANWATYAASAGPGDNTYAYFTYTASSGTQPNLNAVTQIAFSATLPFGSAPSFTFGDLTAVPEPTNVALGVFGGLALAVGGVRAGRRLMIARRTA